MNYEFLLMVRDKKYPEALDLGRKSNNYYMIVLKNNPDNPSVKKFVTFIEGNVK